MPAASSRSTTSSETSGTNSALVAEPNVVRTPAVWFRSLTAVGTPNSTGSDSGPASGPVSRDSASRAWCRASLPGDRDERADVVTDPVDPREVVLDELDRGDLVVPDRCALLERGQVMEGGHAVTLPAPGSGTAGERRRLLAVVGPHDPQPRVDPLHLHAQPRDAAVFPGSSVMTSVNFVHPASVSRYFHTPEQFAYTMRPRSLPSSFRTIRSWPGTGRSRLRDLPDPATGDLRALLGLGDGGRCEEHAAEQRGGEHGRPQASGRTWRGLRSCGFPLECTECGNSPAPAA